MHGFTLHEVIRYAIGWPFQFTILMTFLVGIERVLHKLYDWVEARLWHVYSQWTFPKLR
jgi:hypothetical protein